MPGDDSLVVYNSNRRRYVPSEYTIDDLLAGGGSPPDEGAASPVEWTKLVANDPMTSNVGGNRWVASVGTWAFGSNGVEQTGGVENGWLRLNQDLTAYDHRVLEALVRIESGSGVGVGVGLAGGSWDSGSLGAAIFPSNDTVWYDRYGSGGGSSPFVSEYATEYRLRFVEAVRRNMFYIYVNGVRVWDFVRPSYDVNVGAIGLYTRSTSAARFSDVSVWGGRDVRFEDLP